MADILNQIEIKARNKAENFLIDFLNNDYDLLTTYVDILNEYEKLQSKGISGQDFENYYFQNAYLDHILSRLRLFIARQYLRDNGYENQFKGHISQWIKL